jgi:hypothetical protein
VWAIGIEASEPGSLLAGFHHIVRGGRQEGSEEDTLLDDLLRRPE